MQLTRKEITDCFETAYINLSAGDRYAIDRQINYFRALVKGGDSKKVFSRSDAIYIIGGSILLSMGVNIMKLKGAVIGNVFYKYLPASRGSNTIGWILNTEEFQQIKEMKLVYVVLTDTENDRKFQATITDFDEYGICFPEDIGNKIVLPFGYWKEYKEVK
jgi:hypothetical protein